MLNQIFAFMQSINQFLWSGPLLVLLGATHIILSFKLKFPQRFVFHGIKLSICRESDSPNAPLTADGPLLDSRHMTRTADKISSTAKDETSLDSRQLTSTDKKKVSAKTGTMNGFTALATSLAATLGTGNIVGVSTAIAAGGPGALFWCWLTGLLGMATAYAECFLSVVYRKPAKDGTYSGSPMTVMERGLKCKPMACFYGLALGLAGLTAGCTTQAFAISDAACSLWGISPHLVGILLALLTGSVILGGAKRIGRFCTSVVPILGFLYIGACLYLLFQNRSYLIPSLQLIWDSLFTPQSITGGILGGSLLNAARYGIARGLFTNEAGIGTAAIAAGHTDIDNPIKQGLISMTAVFWDTIVMCALTGLVIISNVLRFPHSTEGFSGAGLTSAAFLSFPFGGTTFLTLTLVAFAVATLIGWCYIGEKGTNYLWGNKGTRAYEILYIVMIYVGAILPLEYVWGLTDFVNGMMVFPNVLSLLLLRHILTPPTRQS